MTIAIPGTEPSQITAGDRLQWTRDLPDFPVSAGWVLKYVLSNSAGKITINTTGAGITYSVDVSPTSSAIYAAGDYSWAAYVTNTGERRTIDQGTLTIAPNLDALANFDGRSYAVKLLAQVEAALLALNMGTKRYMIGNREYWARDIVPELLPLRDRLRMEVANEKAAELIANGIGNPRTIRLRFGRA